MKSPKARKPLFDRLKAGLEEGILHAKGEITLRTTTLELPGRPPEIGAAELRQLRLASGMSRDVFARMLNVSTKTVQSWEQGKKAVTSGLEADPGVLSESLHPLGSGRNVRAQRKGE